MPCPEFRGGSVLLCEGSDGGSSPLLPGATLQPAPPSGSASPGQKRTNACGLPLISPPPSAHSRGGPNHTGCVRLAGECLDTQMASGWIKDEGEGTCRASGCECLPGFSGVGCAMCSNDEACQVEWPACRLCARMQHRRFGTAIDAVPFFHTHELRCRSLVHGGGSQTHWMPSATCLTPFQTGHPRPFRGTLCAPPRRPRSAAR